MDERQNKPTPQSAGQPHETDTQKLVHRHLSDPDHVITDEEMQNLQVGQTPPEVLQARQETPEADERVADTKSIKDDETAPGAQKVTPWDVINP